MRILTVGKILFPEAFHYKRLALYAALILFIALQFFPPPEGLTDAGWKTVAIACLMAILWITEALPLAVTALIPLVAFPFADIGTAKEAGRGYAANGVLLILGGFILAAGLQRWKLHVRIAMLLVKSIGTQAQQVTAGFMIASAFLSMWINNTATVVVMLPIALSVIGLVQQRSADEWQTSRFAACLMLAIAYSATIGGMMTLVGTTPNLLFKGYMEENYSVTIGFVEWMMVGTPIGLLLLAASWWLLTHLIFPVRLTYEGGSMEEIIDETLKKLGPITVAEKRMLGIFGLVIGLWLMRDWLNDLAFGLKLNDMSIALLGAILCFILPSGMGDNTPLLRWDATQREIPWGILLLLGGAISLAGFLNKTGVAAWIGQSVDIGDGTPVFLVILLVSLLVMCVSELMSNLATLTAFLPVVFTLAPGTGENPLMIVIPATLAASGAFMFPISTPPNAIIYGSGKVSIAQMARAGLIIKLASVVVIVGLSYYLTPLVFDIMPAAETLPGQ